MSLYTVCIGAIVILSNFVIELMGSAEVRARGAFLSETAKFTREAKHAVSLIIDNVSSVGAFFESSQQVNEREFARYVIRSRLMSGFSHADTIYIMPLLNKDELPAFKAALDDRTQQRIESGYPLVDIQTVPGREMYAPAIYIESTHDRSPLLGYDLAADPVLLHTARSAMILSYPHMTAPLPEMRGQTDDSVPVMIIGAVKSEGNLGLRPYKADEAERTLFIVARFMPSRALDHMLRALPGTAKFALRVTDVTEETASLVFNSSGIVTDAEPSASERLVLGNRVWQFDYFPDPVTAANNPNSRFILLGTLGCLLTVALTIALDRLLKARGVLEKQVGERTEQLNTLNKALVESASRASAESDAKSLFLAHMSHELRTPLNAVIGYAQMLSSEIFGPLSDPRYVSYANTIEEAGKIQLQLVEDILALTALQADKRELARSPLDLNIVAEKCIGIVSTRAEEKQLRLSIQSLLGIQPFYGDERSIQQILLNLLSNAIKFTPPGGEIIIRLARDNRGSTSIVVEDNGIGIAPENLDKVLQPFSQANRNAYNAHEGVGLGLSIVNGLVEMNGGTIRLESELGKGTIVIVEFPATPPADAA